MLPEPIFIALQRVIPKHLTSRVLGKLAECRIPAVKNTLIRAFIRRYQVDLGDAAVQNIEDFCHFNDFFTRALRDDARPISDQPNAIACPADGAVSEIGNIELGNILQAKGLKYSLFSLLAGDQALCDRLQGGRFATIYLAPRDYHRVHMPADGRLTRTTYVPGKLFSVNQATANRIPGLFARNERLICEFEGDNGPFVMILVGAVVVAGIETVWAGEITPVRPRLHSTDYTRQDEISLKKGEEMGRFKLGSTVILLFPEQAGVSWDNELHNAVPTRMGQTIGTYNP